MGVATCKMTGDKSAWDLNGKTIEKDDKVTCDTKCELKDRKTPIYSMNVYSGMPITRSILLSQ